MTRVAAVYDIHGNLPALEAVLEDIRRAGVDLLLVGGDVVPGPMPRETLTCLLTLDIPAEFIQGNGESEVLACMSGIETGNVPEPVREVVRWVGEQLDDGYGEVLASWPDNTTQSISGLGDVFFCHATPRSKTEIFSSRTPAERLQPIFETVNAPLVVCGHTHMQFDRMIGSVRVVNAGSVGMPFGGSGAYWLLLGPDDVQLCRTAYDLNEAAQRIRATSYPRAHDFAERNVMQPPSEKEILAMYARAELK